MHAAAALLASQPCLPLLGLAWARLGWLHRVHHEGRWLGRMLGGVQAERELQVVPTNFDGKLSRLSV